MKKKFILSLVLLLSIIMQLQAAPPTVPSSSLSFPAATLDGNRFSMSFNKGNGAFRIIVVKQGSAVSTLPVNGTDYSANAAFGTAGTEFAPNDGYVIFKGSNGSTSVSQTVTNLQANTTYYVSIFEFNGTSAATEYLTIALSGNVVTKSAPTSQATITSFTAVAGNKLTVNWSIGNGEKRLLIARKAAAVNATPVNLVDYSHSTTFGSGAVLNGDNYIVYKGSATSAIITGLEPNTVYHFAIFEYNGNLGPVYLSPGAVNNQITNAGPTQGPGAISFNNIEGNRLTLNFGAGNGKYQLIIARQGAPVTAVPVNGQTYTANTAFGSGQQIAAGEYVVNTLNTDRTFTSLLPSTTYYFRVFEFDVDANGNTYYLTGASSQNNSSTATAPTQQASNVRFENITGSTMSIKHDAGNSSQRLIVMKQGSPVDATPSDLTKYTGNANFGQGQQITPGNYVMIGGQNGTQLNVSGLTPGLTYHVAVFGFNGNSYPVYAIPGATGSITIPNEPTAIGTGLLFSLQQANSFRMQWTGGDGSKRIVIARKNSPVTAVPVDGTTYTANASFGSGTEISTGQFVVYDDVNRVLDLQNLEIGATYHFAIFEYNTSAAGPDYLNAVSLQGNATTLIAPTNQTSGLSAGNIQNTQATINYSAGNGSSRMLIMRAGSPVNVEPQDLVNYNYSSVYGLQEIGVGNYVVLKSTSGNNVVVTGLSPNTQYFVTAFEYNGSSGPVYLRPGTSFNFITTGSGVAAPTVNASAAAFSLVDGNKFSLSWVNGDGAKRIVVMKQGSAVSFNPTHGNDYTANANFGTGTDLGGGQYVVFNGTQNIINVANLLPATTYHFAIFEYNGSAATTTYLTSGALTASQGTASTPTAGSTGLNGTASNLSINISWVNGPGAGRIVVMKEGSAITGSPSNLSKYPANAVFQNGSQIAAGEYIVYAGNGNAVTVTGLLANKVYHYTVFEYNGIDAPIYNTANAISGSAVVSNPLPLNWLYVNANHTNAGILLKWGTAQEMNVSHFEIERKTGSENFKRVGTITAKGSSLQNDYNFTDAAQLTGTVYYRIKQVDRDNRFTYSSQIRLQVNEQDFSAKLFPNPSTDHVFITLPKGMEQAEVKIFDVQGKQVKAGTIRNGDKFLLPGLSRGIYNVLILDKQNSYNEKLVIQ